MDFTALILVAVIAVVIVTLLSVGYDYLLYFRQREKALQKKENELSANSRELMEHAHHRATILLAKTTEIAEKMLVQSEFLNGDIQKRLDQTMQSVIEDNKKLLEAQTELFDKSYSEDLTQIRSEYLNQVKNVVSEIRTSTEQELKDFMNVIMKETLSSQTFIGKKITEEFETAQKEIEAYKAEQFKKIDESIKKAIISISEKVLGKAIPLSQHEKLVLDALEVAKREGMFQEV